MNRKKSLLAIIMAFTAFFFAVMAYADDITKEENIESIYTDHKAYKAGDIVTIYVVESTTGSQSAQLTTSKNQSIQGGMGTSVWSGGQAVAFPSWGAAGQENQAGGGTSVRSGSLIAKIAARVEKVLSNGNLTIKGTKIIKINDEDQNLVITGVVRPEDISSDNVVSSMNVADAKIEYEGKGPIGEKTSPGIITRLLDWIGIF
jgi:flagellar L-ring protein precursor FlgH